MKTWERTLATITPVVITVYTVPVGLIVGLLLGLLPLPGGARVATSVAFWPLIAVAVIVFPVSFVLGGRRLNTKGLRMPAGTGNQDAIVDAAARRIRSSALITAALGASIAALGVVHAVVAASGDRLIYFLALVVAHAVFTVGLFAKARRAVVTLAGRL